VSEDTRTERWAIFGGTFDPVHLAHLAIAEWAAEELDLSGVLWVPAGMPPHKEGRAVTPARHRAAMVELAVCGNPRFRVSRIEIERQGPSYSVDTVRALTAEGGTLASAEVIFLVSAEALRDLPTWHEPDELLALTRIAVVPRRGYPSPSRAWLGEHFPDREARFIALGGPDLGNSSSEVRRRAAEGRSIRYLVPEPVRAYIEGNRLYPPELWTKN
jgi:nicotinate-nucleotide adenylyltransferase